VLTRWPKGNCLRLTVFGYVPHLGVRVVLTWVEAKPSGGEVAARADHMGEGGRVPPPSPRQHKARVRSSVLRDNPYG
jgi:hypothetical protein